MQLGETAVFGKVVNEVRVQWSRQDRSQQPPSLDPTLQVQDAFTGGGSGVGLSSRGDDRSRSTTCVTWSKGTHVVPRGPPRCAATQQADISRQGFNGTVTFAGTFGPELDALGPPGARRGRPARDRAGHERRALPPHGAAERARLLARRDPRARPAAPASCRSRAAIPYASVRQWDFAGFLQDDWKPRPDLTLGLGLRLESQTNLGSSLDLAPRFTASWSPGYSGKGTPKTVLRAGAGMFYDRVDDGLVLEANRFDGDVPKRYLVTDAALLDQIVYDAAGNVASLPSFDELGSAAQPQVVRELARRPARPGHAAALARRRPRAARQLHA